MIVVTPLSVTTPETVNLPSVNNFSVLVIAKVCSVPATTIKLIKAPMTGAVTNLKAILFALSYVLSVLNASGVSIMPLTYTNGVKLSDHFALVINSVV